MGALQLIKGVNKAHLCCFRWNNRHPISDTCYFPFIFGCLQSFIESLSHVLCVTLLGICAGNELCLQFQLITSIIKSNEFTHMIKNDVVVSVFPVPHYHFEWWFDFFWQRPNIRQRDTKVSEIRLFYFQKWNSDPMKPLRCIRNQTKWTFTSAHLPTIFNRKPIDIFGSVFTWHS